MLYFQNLSMVMDCSFGKPGSASVACWNVPFVENVADDFPDVELLALPILVSEQTVLPILVSEMTV